MLSVNSMLHKGVDKYIILECTSWYDGKGYSIDILQN